VQFRTHLRLPDKSLLRQKYNKHYPRNLERDIHQERRKAIGQELQRQAIGSMASHKSQWLVTSLEALVAWRERTVPQESPDTNQPSMFLRSYNLRNICSDKCREKCYVSHWESLEITHLIPDFYLEKEESFLTWIFQLKGWLFNTVEHTKTAVFLVIMKFEFS
jgi:hypothetical protein